MALATKTDLVDEIKEMQRSDPVFKGAWGKYCGGMRDPNRHEANQLQTFLTLYHQGSLAPGPPEEPSSVERIKDLQRTDNKAKEAWWKYCDMNLSGKKDPSLHDETVLQNFLTSYNMGSLNPENDLTAVSDAGVETQPELVRKVKHLQRSDSNAKQAMAKYKREHPEEAAMNADLEKAIQEHTKDPTGFTFYFLKADRLRKWKPQDGLMKSFQELFKEPGSLIHERIDFGHLLRGDYACSHGVASHRWKKPAHPDEDCEQLQAISEWLNQPANRTIRRLWVDYSCLPQGEKKTKLEKAYFDAALDTVNRLYLGLHVVILLDRSYLNRFWCNYEAFLSMHTAHENGIQSSKEDFRYSILCQGTTKGKEEKWIPLLRDWKSKSPEEALEELAKDDIEVTNMSDKTKQIEKLATLDEDIKKLWEQTKP